MHTHRFSLWLLIAVLAIAIGLLVGGVAGARPARTGGSSVTARARVPFPAAAPFDYQIGGAYPPPAGVQIVSRDRAARPAPGLYNICYVNAFQAQTAEVRWWQRNHPNLLLRNSGGRLVIDHNWNEPLLDTATATKRRALAGIVGRWFDGCAAKGFQAIEPDNLDSYQRSGGRLTLADNLAFVALLIRRAHADGLAIGQKNLAEEAAPVHALGADFAIAEQCQQYQECGSYTHVYGHRLIDIEYARAPFLQACRLHAGQYSIVLRDLNVAPAGTRGYVDARCSA